MALKEGDLKIAVDEIASKYGGSVTPRQVVDEASDPSHKLHGEFDWNDQSAADKHRLATAAALLRRIQYIGMDVKGRPVAAAGYVYDSPTNTHVPLSQVLRNKKQSMALLMQELKAIESIVRRAQRIADVAHLREHLDDMLHKVVDLQELAEQPPPKPTRSSRKGRGGEARASA